MRALVAVDRRRSHRFRLSPSIRYRQALGPTRVGKLDNISGTGLLFHSESPLLEGRRIYVTVPWPYHHEGGCSLQLRIAGVVLRSNDSGTAVKIRSFEFHTVKSLSALPLAAAPLRIQAAI